MSVTEQWGPAERRTHPLAGDVWTPVVVEQQIVEACSTDAWRKWLVARQVAETEQKYRVLCRVEQPGSITIYYRWAGREWFTRISWKEGS